MFNVINVGLNTRLHFVDGICFATQSIDLRPSSDARLDLVAQHVARYQLHVLVIVRERVRTWTDDAHVALQYVDELRQLVQTG